ncbi:hypothetical protein [Clostridium algidicarnis]|uniref:Uncharacterized protein n=2 Tax=Clostridium algidicarnis TaxID=37659 RepID=A0A2S6FW82_9CLOT|nr:hypothetical protein [Clostridium algidicarnis]MBB6631081.1 hypothetical protein [Clostridium algidicarnis]MBB6696603.1 hypothetical protein [Clostridium algidicarnis]MBU3194300.1 hypothetical protein [Clostridium algidicarnis]MBU3207438.1 hypothetical protein [Clostridium algidicarnis]MBU3220228.1 hypothetical protein [Clostridium algidicarnis]
MAYVIHYKKIYLINLGGLIFRELRNSKRQLHDHHLERILNEEEKKVALMSFIDKYSPEFNKEGSEYINRAVSKTNIVKITIDKATAKGNLK